MKDLILAAIEAVVALVKRRPTPPEPLPPSHQDETHEHADRAIEKKFKR